MTWTCEHLREWNRKWQERKRRANGVPIRKMGRTPEEFRRYHRDWKLRKRYGVTLVEFERLAAKQRNRCGICVKVKPLVLDHNHRNGKARGLLCRSCNLGIGALRTRRQLLNAVLWLRRGRIK